MGLTRDPVERVLVARAKIEQSTPTFWTYDTQPGYDGGPARGAGPPSFIVVEVPGIEPGSFVVLSGLLRAQLTMPLLGPTNHVSKLV